MNKLALTLTSLLLPLAAPTFAQEQPGDIVVAFGEGPQQSIKFFGDDGAMHREIPGMGSTWVASAQMPDGRLVVNDTNFMRSVVFYDSNGQYSSSFDYTPAYYSSDLDVLSDGLIVICSRLEGLLIYHETGSLATTLYPAGMTSPNGLQVQDDDSIWVADLMNFNNPGDGRIWHLDRFGNVLHTFPTLFDATDVAMAPNGTVWVSDNAGRLVNFDIQGNILHEFDAQIATVEKDLWSLAVTGDGIIWAAGRHDITLVGYTDSGAVVSSFDMHTDAKPGFIWTVPGITWVSSLCAGDMSAGLCPCGNVTSGDEGCQNSTGAGATLIAGGTSSVSLDYFNMAASGLPANRPAIAFVGPGNMGGGNGALFGDGLRCVSGKLTRLGTRISDGSGNAVWGPGMGYHGAWAGGDTRYFQVWYSDPAGPCTAGSNSTNAIEVHFIP